MTDAHCIAIVATLLQGFDRVAGELYEQHRQASPFELAEYDYATKEQILAGAQVRLDSARAFLSNAPAPQ